MKQGTRYGWGALAGVAGGVASVFVLGFFFGIARGIIQNPAYQSPKLIAVWTSLHPLPRAVTQPWLIFLGFVLLGALHGLVFAQIAPSLPGRGWRKGLSFAVVLWVLMPLFFEFYTPWNMFHEPEPLVLLELLLWVPGMLAEGLTIAAIYSDNPA